MHLLVSLNAQWPGFASTDARPWSKRCPELARIAKATKASILVVQEMGAQERADFARALGSDWGYKGAYGQDNDGLNGVFWRRSEWEYDHAYEWTLDSFGQRTRTLITAKLSRPSGEYVWAASTHLASAAADLSAAAAIEARKVQAAQIGDLLDGFRQLIIGADWNSSYPASVKDSVRQILTARGFTFPTPLKDSEHNGIDGCGAKSRVHILSESVVPLGWASDHDGRLARFEVVT